MKPSRIAFTPACKHNSDISENCLSSRDRIQSASKDQELCNPKNTNNILKNVEAQRVETSCCNMILSGHSTLVLGGLTQNHETCMK